MGRTHTSWARMQSCRVNPCWLRRQTNGRNSPKLHVDCNAQTRNNKSDDNDTSAVFRFLAATFPALIIQSGRWTDRPASPPPPSVKLTDTQNPGGSGCAGLVLPALQYIDYLITPDSTKHCRSENTQSKHKLDARETVMGTPSPRLHTHTHRDRQKTSW